MQKILSSKRVFKAKLFDVAEEKLIDAGGKEYTFHSVRARPVAAVIPITPKKEVFLIDQYRYLFGKRMLGVVAGVIDEGESPLTTAKRELKEEAGIVASQWEMIHKVELARGSLQQTHYLFLARDLELGLQELKDEEDISVIKIPLSEAVTKVMTGEIYHSVSMIAILLLDKLRQEKRL